MTTAERRTRRQTQQEWTPEQVGRTTVAVIALVILAAGVALGVYGYTPSRIPQRFADLASAILTPTDARGWFWAIVVAVAVAVLASIVFRAQLYFRATLIVAAILVGAIVTSLVLYVTSGTGADVYVDHLTRSAARRLIIVVGIEAVVCAVVLRGRHEIQRRRQFIDGLAEAFPKHIRRDYNPRKKCDTRRWRNNRPQWVRFALPKGFASTSRSAMEDLDKEMADRMGGKVTRQLNTAGTIVTYTLSAIKAEDIQRDYQVDRIAQAATNQFRTDIHITKVREWGGEGNNMPIAFTAKYPPGLTSIEDAATIRRVEAGLSSALGLRVRSHFQPTRDLVEFDPRPELPKDGIQHPGPENLQGCEWPDGDWNILPIGIDEERKLVEWNALLQSHALGNGATNSGKTVTARNVIIAALIKGWECYLADPKQIELVGFAHDWGVKSIAATPEDMADLIARIQQLMDERYTEIRNKIDRRIDPEIEKTYRPVLVVIDEFAELVEVLGKVDAVWALLRLARACNIHLLIMTQRPDASDFKKGARDNLTFRFSMNALSEQGAKMMWENTEWGRYIPAVKGRGMAGVYGQEPIEVQVYWVPDPAFPKSFEDITLRDRLRAACRNVQAGVPASITGADYDMPEVQPAPEGDLANIVTDPGELLPVILNGATVEAATVLAETVTANDQIVIDDQAWDVINVRQSDDQMTIDLDAVDGSSSRTITRTITDHVLSVVTTGKTVDSADDNETVPSDDKGAILLNLLSNLTNRTNKGGRGNTNNDNTPAEPAPTADDEDLLILDDDPHVNASSDDPSAEPPIPLFGIDDDDDDDFFRPPPEDDRPEEETGPEQPMITPSVHNAPDSPSAEADADLAATLRRTWEALSDPAARTALLNSAPDTPSVQALRAELEPANQPVSRPATPENPWLKASTEPAADTTPPTTRQPGPSTNDPEDHSDRRPADSITVGQRIMWKTKKGSYSPYTVEQVDITDDETVRLTLKPRRGQSKIIELNPTEQVRLATADAA